MFIPFAAPRAHPEFFEGLRAGRFLFYAWVEEVRWMERLTKLAAPRRGRIERGKPGVIIRVLDLVQLHQAETGSDRFSYRRLQMLARCHDPALLERGRINWGLHFLVQQGHVERVQAQEYRLLEA